MALLVLVLLLAAETVTEKSVRAKAALSAGDYMLAAALYDELSQSSPHTEEFQTAHGLALVRAGRFRDALTPLARALALNNEGPAVLLTGIAYARLDWPTAAIPHLEQALRLHPGNDLIILELARAYAAAAKPDLAEPLLKSIPESREHHAIRARLERLAGRHKAAVAEWDLALRYAPDDQDVLLERARSMRDAGELEQAEESLALLTPSAARNLAIAEIAVERGQPDRALMPALDAARRAPQLLPARVLAGRLLLDAGRPTEALPHLEAARALGGDVRRELRRARRHTRTP